MSSVEGRNSHVNALPVIRERQQRPLQSVHAMEILEAISYSVRENLIVMKMAVYFATGNGFRLKKGRQ